MTPFSFDRAFVLLQSLDDVIVLIVEVGNRTCVIVKNVDAEGQGNVGRPTWGWLVCLHSRSFFLWSRRVDLEFIRSDKIAFEEGGWMDDWQACRLAAR